MGLNLPDLGQNQQVFEVASEPRIVRICRENLDVPTR
jgi:hypothetical protein